MKPKLVIWGASGHARVVADIVRLEGAYEIAGFLDDTKVKPVQSEFCGAVILGGREQLDALFKQGVKHLIVGIGDCQSRLQLAAVALANGFRLATARHPRATIAADTHIGGGTVVAAGVVVNPGTSVGENVIINTSASVDHDCVIAAGAHLSPGVHLAGNVVVGRATWIGIGATVSDRTQIGADTVIGAGSVVLHDIPDGVLAYGVPARIIRRIVNNDE
jgi:UDP-N-acetylbacillosamine N-acetyltransferase